MIMKFIQTLVSVIVEISNNIEEANDGIRYRKDYRNNYTGYKRY
ncbi:hypothetical protein AB2T96_20995 [Clostridium butyricum]